MSRLIPLTAAALTLALALPQAAAAQDHGKGHGKSDNQGAGASAREARGQERDGGPGQGRGQDRGQGQERGQGQDRGAGRERAAAPAAPPLREARQDRREDRREDDRGAVRAAVRPAGEARDGRDIVFLRRAPDRGLIAGCPPGLAKKNNGCLPPGQARQLDRIVYDAPRYASLWGPRADNWDYRYRDGYLYRVTPQGSLLGWLPVLGGALSPGSAWPGQYQFEPAPAYYADYYGLNRDLEYRYADGALYGVDPRTGSISQVAALLTGQDWAVGRPMPAGYDVYNLPYGYRDRYVDTPRSLYRYDDGHVYQVDPTTQLVQAVIQLLT
ncbi:MAG: hypothetical protein KJ690_09385 [Alphaproteobacteria bacterium]|nr:hypothetical protein [Alphaproteobacteria bacterium]